MKVVWLTSVKRKIIYNINVRMKWEHISPFILPDPEKSTQSRRHFSGKSFMKISDSDHCMSLNFISKMYVLIILGFGVTSPRPTHDMCKAWGETGSYLIVTSDMSGELQAHLFQREKKKQRGYLLQGSWICLNLLAKHGKYHSVRTSLENQQL